MMSLRMAFRNVFRHKLRSAITLGTLMIASAAIVFSGGFFEDVCQKVRETEIQTHTGHLQIFRKGFFKAGAGQPFDFLIENPTGLKALLREQPEVERFSSRLDFGGLLSTGENTVTCIVQGVENSGGVEGGLRFLSGQDVDSSTPSGLVIGQGLAAGLSTGANEDLVLLVRTVDDSVNGMDVHVQGVVESGSKDYDDILARIPLSTAQQLLRTNSIQSVFVFLKNTDDTDRVKKNLERAFEANGLDLEIKTWEQTGDFTVKTIRMFREWFFIIQLIIGMIVFFSIYNTMTMSVLERTSEIGTLRALGQRPSAIRRLFVSEGLMIGVVGGCLGVALGAVAALVCSSMGLTMPPMPGFTEGWLCTPLIHPPFVLQAFCIAVLASVLSSIVPAYRASKRSIADALRHIS